MLVSLITLSMSSCAQEISENSKEEFTISQMIPQQAYSKDTVKIIGKGFENTKKVTFDEVEAKILARNSNELLVIVPLLKDESESVVTTIPVKVYSSTQYRSYNFGFKHLYTYFNLEKNLYRVDTLEHHRVGPGTIFTSLRLWHDSFPLKVFFLTSTLHTPGLRFSPVLAGDTLGAVENIQAMAVRKTSEGNGTYFTGVNVDFFNIGGDNRVLDGLWLDGHPVATPTEKGVGSLIIDKQGEMGIDEISYSPIQLSMNGKIAFIYDMNNKRKPNSIILYNKYNGYTTGTESDGTEVIIQLASQTCDMNTPIKFRVVEVRKRTGNTTIPADCYVISAQGKQQDFFDGCKIGDQGSLTFTLEAKGQPLGQPLHIMGAKQIILKDGEPTSYVWNEHHPRTALGLSADGETLYQCVVDGRQPTSVGVTTMQLAALMKQAGASTVFNLDGGGSSTMYVANTGYQGKGLVNRPAGGTYMRKVANGFFAIADVKSDNQIAEIASKNYLLCLKKGETVTLSFCGLNKYGLIVEDNLQGVRLTTDTKLGQIDGHRFTPSGELLHGSITALYQGKSIRIKVIVDIQ